MLEHLLCQTLSVRGRVDVPVASLACHDEHGEQVGKIVEAVDQKVGRDHLGSATVSSFLHVVNEILERGLYDDAIKPGSIVVDGTDVVDDGSD